VTSLFSLPSSLFEPICFCVSDNEGKMFNRKPAPESAVPGSKDSKLTVKRRTISTQGTTIRRGPFYQWAGGQSTGRPTTRSYYIQIPTGQPIWQTTLSRRAGYALSLLPTLPPAYEHRSVALFIYQFILYDHNTFKYIIIEYIN